MKSQCCSNRSNFALTPLPLLTAHKLTTRAPANYFCAQPSVDPWIHTPMFTHLVLVFQYIKAVYGISNPWSGVILLHSQEWSCRVNTINSIKGYIYTSTIEWIINIPQPLMFLTRTKSYETFQDAVFTCTHKVSKIHWSCSNDPYIIHIHGNVYFWPPQIY